MSDTKRNSPNSLGESREIQAEIFELKQRLLVLEIEIETLKQQYADKQCETKMNAKKKEE